MGIKRSLVVVLVIYQFEFSMQIGSKDSIWYTMECGIHQEGYLSLLKYTAYIDSLITSLETSNLCRNIDRVKT